MTKICSSCKVEKPLEDFAPEKFGGRFGRKARCRICFCEARRPYNQEYYRQNRERILRKQAENYAKKRGKK